MKYQEKKPNFKPKYEEKEQPRSKFNFHYDEDAVNFKTAIPDLPQKLASKPNEKHYQKKVSQLEKEIQQLKNERQKKKNQFKAGTKNYSDDITQLKHKINLGKKCLIVLNYDLAQLNNALLEIQLQTQENKRILNEIRKNPRKREEVEYEKMTYDQLEKEIQKLSVRVSTASLTKKQQTDINALITKLNRFKLTAQKGPRQIDESEIQENKRKKEANENIRKFNRERQNHEKQIKEINYKIESINDDVEEFEENLEEIQKKRRDPEVAGLYEQSQDLKKKIYSLRDELAETHETYLNQKYSYEYEQEKIKWAKWASEIKEAKIKGWEEEKAAKRRQKMFKSKEKRGEETNDKKQGQEEGKAQQRQKINRFQKEIDACLFLINYCKQLVPSTKSKKQQAEEKDKANVEDQLKRGEWAKMKGVEIIKCKKEKNLEEEREKKISKKATQKEKGEENAEQDPNAINHEFFVSNVFDSVNVLPPPKVQDVEKTIADLNEKLEYYASHPEGPAVKTEKVQKEKQKYTAQKYAKAKNQNKKIINTEDFPAL